MPVASKAAPLTEAPPSVPALPTVSRPHGSFLERHPVLIYFVLVFALSWGAFLLLTGGLGPVGTADPRFMFVAFSGPVAPAIVGLLLTGLVAGGPGYRDLLSRLVRWRVGLRWYAVAFLVAPLSTIVATIIVGVALRSPDVLPSIVSDQNPLRALLVGVIGGLVAGLCEELGWTGFAIPRLRLRLSIMSSGLLVGVVWGAWHFPLFREQASFSGALPLALLLVQLFTWITAYRVMMVWLYDHTHSLLVVVLMHATLIANNVLLRPAGLSDAQALFSVLIWAGLQWTIVAAIAVTSRGELTRGPTADIVAAP